MRIINADSLTERLHRRMEAGATLHGDDVEALIATEPIVSRDADLMEFIGASEVADLMRCSVPQARQIMRRKDFPAVKIGKAIKVMKGALIEWARERRI